MPFNQCPLLTVCWAARRCYCLYVWRQHL